MKLSVGFFYPEPNHISPPSLPPPWLRCQTVLFEVWLWSPHSLQAFSLSILWPVENGAEEQACELCHIKILLYSSQSNSFLSLSEEKSEALGWIRTQSAPIPVTSLTLFSRTLSNVHFTPASPASLLFPKHTGHSPVSGPWDLLLSLSIILLSQTAVWLGPLLCSGPCSNITSASPAPIVPLNIKPFSHQVILMTVLQSWGFFLPQFLF